MSTSPVSPKEKILSQCFSAFPKCAWSLEHFEKKDECPILIISEMINSERDGYYIVQKVFVQNTIR